MNHVLDESNYKNDLFMPQFLVKLVYLSGLVHDIGKATLTFQPKLVDDEFIGKDVLRHERLSCALLSSIMSVMFDEGLLSEGTDKEFFTAISSIDINGLLSLFKKAAMPDAIRIHYSTKSVEEIQDLSKSIWCNDDQYSVNTTFFNALYFLVLSHHKMPHHHGDSHDVIVEKGYVHERNATTLIEWHSDAPIFNKDWVANFQKVCKEIAAFDLTPVYENIEAFTSSVLFYARPAFIIADQNVTAVSVEDAKTRQLPANKNHAFANSYTDKNNNRHLAQPLDEHLYFVADKARNILEIMLSNENESLLPSLLCPPSSLKEFTDLPQFKWQNTALRVAEELPCCGNLILISADTGAGKTRANAKVMSALRNHSNVRFTTLLGMNTLTKQTATEYISDMGLGNDACAITGHALTKFEIKKTLEAADGRENTVEDIDFEIIYKSEPRTIPKAFHCSFKPKYNQILATPIVVATIDHIIECVQGSKSTNSRLLQRLQTSDLIIDEIDSYSTESLVPIYKLVYLAGFYNRNLIVSSATLRPAVAYELLRNFKLGMEHGNFVFNTNNQVTGAVINNADNTTFKADNGSEFKSIIDKQREAVRRAFILKQKKPKRRLGFIDACTASEIFHHAKKLHCNHHVEFKGFKLSAGVIRLNNVKYVNALSRSLSSLCDKDTEIAVINYHSRIPGPVRYRVEKCLDKILKRKNQSDFESALIDEPEFQVTLDRAHRNRSKNIMIVVVCSPIEETGRDHDFDWGITEPCSNHSLIQLAGRIRRHRDPVALHEPNLYMLNRSLKEVYEPHRLPYLTQPGAELKADIGRESYELTLKDSVSVSDSFSACGVDYTVVVDSRACLLDLEKKQLFAGGFFSLNDIEIQQVHNASYNFDRYSCNPHCRISITHAELYPLRTSNDDIPCWFDGDRWVIPAGAHNNDMTGLSVLCDWSVDVDALPNMWFDSDIDTILSEVSYDVELLDILCSQFSAFMITQMQLKNMSKLYFRLGLGLFSKEIIL